MAAFVTLNHIQTISCKAWRANAACWSLESPLSEPAAQGRLTSTVTRCHIQTISLHIAASLWLPGGFWEVTSLDVGLVALHQAQRYAVLRKQRRGTLMTDDISHAVSSSFGSITTTREVSKKKARAPARKRVDRRPRPQPNPIPVTAHDKGR
ncbi:MULTISPECIES: hypothetical protein [Aeromonas]|uniref:hypothetical protein n=1 Tax=Aeromonas TaxID=642 RepID=UPI0015E80143|nr:hypothetical protein [Aeromonas sp. HMWF014]